MAGKLHLLNNRAMVNSNFPPDIFQSYDCPFSGIDFDLAGLDILATGESTYCSGCGQYHTANEAGITETTIRLVADGDFQYRGLPKDEFEKAEWVSEVVKI